MAMKGLTGALPRDLKIELKSLEHAQELASFPVKIPSRLPEGFELESFEQRWPDHIGKEGRRKKVHADYLLRTYIDQADHWFHIVQGFTGKFIAWTILYEPPADVSGAVEINGRNAVWLTALPSDGLSDQNGNPNVTWTKGAFSYVGWQDGLHPAPEGGVGDSPRYYGLASDSLGVEELLSIAETVEPTPFVTTP